MRQALIIFALCLIGCNKLTFLGIGDDNGKKKPNGKIEGEGLEEEENFSPQASSNDLLDILLVIDNSASMKEEHVLLSSKLQALLSKVSASNWQIAITTTDPRYCVKTIIAKKTPNYEQKFQTAVSEIGSDRDTFYEQATRMAVSALQGDCQTNTWIRNGSAVAILIVTDEDNVQDAYCGTLTDKGFQSMPIDPKTCEVQAFYDYLQTIRTHRLSARVYGLIDVSKSRKFLSWQSPDGRGLFSHYGSVHDKDYTTTLTEVSESIHTIMQYRFTLAKSHSDKKSEVIITFKGGEKTLAAHEYEISDRTLVITGTLPVGTTNIKVKYSVKPTK